MSGRTFTPRLSYSARQERARQDAAHLHRADFQRPPLGIAPAIACGLVGLGAVATMTAGVIGAGWLLVLAVNTITEHLAVLLK